MKPLLIVVSAPSGAGKTSLCDRLCAELPWVEYSISCTTRAPRGSEQNGVDYEFLSQDAFDAYAAKGEFLEHAHVHGFSYGTRRTPVTNALQAGKSVLMDIDVQGAAQIRAAARDPLGDPLIKNAFKDIFIKPPSLEVLRQRLTGRGEDSRDQMEKRMQAAEIELSGADEYRFCIVNDIFDVAYAEFMDLVCREAEVLTGDSGATPPSAESP